jgi:hypothetical protein
VWTRWRVQTIGGRGRGARYIFLFLLFALSYANTKLYFDYVMQALQREINLKIVLDVRPSPVMENERSESHTQNVMAKKVGAHEDGLSNAPKNRHYQKRFDDMAASGANINQP